MYHKVTVTYTWWGIHVKSWKMVFFSCILKEDYWSSFWYGVHSSERRAHRLFKRSFLKEPFRKERGRKKNCRFIVNHASKWRHHGSFQIFFTPPFPLDTWVMMLFYAWVCSPVEFLEKNLEATVMSPFTRMIYNELTVFFSPSLLSERLL